MSNNLQAQINNILDDSPNNQDEFLKEERDELSKQAVAAVESTGLIKEEDRPLYDRVEELPEPKKFGGIGINLEGKGKELADKIREIDVDKKEEETKASAAGLGLGYINLKGLPIMPEALRLIDKDESEKKGIICFLFKEGKEIKLAVLKNSQEVREIIERLRAEHHGIEIKIYLTSRASMDEGIKRYAALPKITERIDEVRLLEKDLVKSTEELVNLNNLTERLQTVSTTEIFSMILVAAIKMEASDIHIEAEEKEIQLRFRVDGVLHDISRLDKEVTDHLMSRIKLISKLKLNIKDKPQDGHFSTTVKGRKVDFRVSTLPTNYGESVVMRILYHDKVQKMVLDNLGIEDYNREIIDRQIIKPNGMIVITGPTGSGKTTTLYAILNKLNTEDNKIITIEDPIEYKIDGINQSEINEERGYTFATALRSVVRQDPDIILVGEIRDHETAEISLNAALTGHLVFSTLHTNDAVGTIPRFLSLGAKPYLLAPALNISVAQRLVRKICTVCREEIGINELNKERVRQALESLPDKFKARFGTDLRNQKFYKGKGCKVCSGLGYKGQIGIFEIFPITNKIRDIILSREISEHTLREIGVKNGMVTMEQDGILKVINGITSLEEVFRVN